MSRLASKELEAAAREASAAAEAPGNASASGSANGAADATAAAMERLVLQRVCSSARDEWHADTVDALGAQLRLSIVVLGASGDLAKKKTYPALFHLFKKGFLPRRLQIVGYARSKMSSPELRDRLRPFLEKESNGDGEAVEQFLNSCCYLAGDYDAPDGYERLGAALAGWEAQMCVGSSAPPPGPRLGRLFYLALPPSVYPQVCQRLREHCGTLYGKGSNGGAAASASAAAGGGANGGGGNGGEGGSRRGAAAPSALLPPEGSFVRLILEKPFGHDLQSSEVLATQIGSFWPEEQLYRIDHYLGKELVQNMLMLRFANPIFGAFFNRHYISNIQITFKEPFGTEGRGGYFDQYGIIRDVIQNHLIQVLALLTMEAPVSLHPDDIRDEKVKVLRCVAPPGPADAVVGQYSADQGQPGYLDDPTVPAGSRTPTFAAVRLLVRNERWDGVPIIIKAGKALNERLAAVRGKGADRGDQQHFVRRDELRAAWAIFTPLLAAVDAGAVPVHTYPYGSRGPSAADTLANDSGYVRTEYTWQTTHPKNKL
ncbi:hypothetical protein GPECTOR_11g9 [Gonium pectorale]|uniref:glucose-6-phosphate dehydrogenase (NADP(+)) n=1 Tax=Gonium pectorale TaxID=33097 RepID=A0A150GQ51_GONPE|nr:hypothetical protein GPECTOR_11g9 [Gonium pectorale]|eukprot:KXZ51967.1 hypothetical protein GPECTOR_11g9 [Gonium pectorale]